MIPLLMNYKITDSASRETLLHAMDELFRDPALAAFMRTGVDGDVTKTRYALDDVTLRPGRYIKGSMIQNCLRVAQHYRR